MRFIPFTILLFLLWATPAAYGQYEHAKDALAARAAFVNFRYPLAEDFLLDDFTSGMEVEYTRHLNSWMNLALPLQLSKAQIPMDEEATTFETISLASADALLQVKFFKESFFLSPYAFAGLGINGVDFESFFGSAPVGAGINFRLSRHLYFTTKAEYHFAFEDQRDNVQLQGGMQFLFGPGKPEETEVVDTDADGVADDEDLCPFTAGLESTYGCPDTDGDGIVDAEDHCPDEVGERALKGCPDSDQDGVADPQDRCPEVAGPQDNEGCPAADRDGDGVVDDRDGCPDQPGPARMGGCPDGDGDGLPNDADRCPEVAGPRSTQGCPDLDGDGVMDSEDRCPQTPGIPNNKGCPEIEQKDRETLDFATQAIRFESNRTRLSEESKPILDRIVQIMRRYPDYKLKISGHTDSIGSRRPNQKLSEERAKSCYDYIVSKGISPTRLEYQGYGESRPIANNKYKEGREINRRVEFDLYLE